MKVQRKQKVRSFVFSVRDPKRIPARTLAAFVDNIVLDIEAYKNSEDIILLTQVTDWCEAKGLPVQQAKMKRNMGMYYFYNKQQDKAYRYINEAVDFFRKRKTGEMLITSLSDLGLLHFFDYQYQLARHYIEEAQRLYRLNRNIRYPVNFLLYYRAGILLSYLKEYDASQKMLETALELARSPHDKGSTVLNMGVNYKRLQRYEEAIACYQKAESLYEPTQLILKCGALNNMAELYKVKGDYDAAIKHIMKAFEYLECKDMAYFFMCFQTYTEIKLLQGEATDIIYQLLDLLRKVKEFFIYKSYIIDGLYIFKKICNKDKQLLTDFEKELKLLLQTAGETSELFRQELDICLDEVRLSLSVLSTN